ncbi:hypothetical protein GF336_02100 [Candidatus Woesearchaeota archaeon]|nr:hypothetical protein [Candidatus Woesearchaeota archaeon]
MVLDSLNRWEKASVIAVFLFLSFTFTFLFVSKPSVTGHVPALYSMEDLEVIVLDDQVYSLSSKDSQPLPIKSMMVSGKIVGEGSVNIYLKHEEESYLIYSNEQEKPSLSAITGFAVKETGDTESNPFLASDDIIFSLKGEDILPEFDQRCEDQYSKDIQAFAALLEEEKKHGQDKEVFVDFVKNTEGLEFKDECIDTCALFGMNGCTYDFVFDVEKGTILLLDKIIYSVEK